MGERGVVEIHGAEVGRLMLEIARDEEEEDENWDVPSGCGGVQHLVERLQARGRHERSSRISSSRAGAAWSIERKGSIGRRLEGDDWKGALESTNMSTCACLQLAGGDVDTNVDMLTSTSTIKVNLHVRSTMAYTNPFSNPQTSLDTSHNAPYSPSSRHDTRCIPCQFPFAFVSSSSCSVFCANRTDPPPSSTSFFTTPTSTRPPPSLRNTANPRDGHRNLPNRVLEQRSPHSAHHRIRRRPVDYGSFDRHFALRQRPAQEVCLACPHFPC